MNLVYDDLLVPLIVLLFLALHLAVALAIGRIRLDLNKNTTRIIKQLDHIASLLSPYGDDK
jgi:hypothetical protein